MQIQISWLLQNPNGLDLHCLQRQDISRFSRTRINACMCACLCVCMCMCKEKKIHFVHSCLLSGGLNFRTFGPAHLPYSVAISMSASDNITCINYWKYKTSLTRVVNVQTIILLQYRTANLHFQHCTETPGPHLANCWKKKTSQE